MTGDDPDLLAQARWLASPSAQQPLADARGLVAGPPGGAAPDLLAAGGALRRLHPDLPPALATAALDQATLGRRARERYGIDDPGLLLTRDGLEAATRPEVAARRARLVAAAGAGRVVDLTAGLGLDTRAFLDAGLRVTAVERDPVTAVLLAHNCPAATVIVGEAQQVAPDLISGLGPLDVVFVDPARRDPAGPRDLASGRARPERDPERWSPPWSAVASLPHPRVLAKVSPGFDPPDDWQAEWVSVDRTVVECTAASWPLAPARRQAVVFSGAVPTVVVADDQRQPPIADEVGTWVHEPDPAVLRAGALGALARSEGLLGIDLQSTWLTSVRSSSSPAVRSHLVVAELSGSARAQRRRLDDLGVDRLVVKSRDVDVSPASALRSLDRREGPGHVLILTRREGSLLTLLAQPAAAQAS